MLSRPSVRTYKRNMLSRNSSENASPWSSQIAEPPWTDPSLQSGTCARELVRTYKNNENKKSRTGNDSFVEPS